MRVQIVELRVSNVKRVQAVRFKPDPGAHVIVVQGPNGAGKSSVIDAIAYAIGGPRMTCPEPLRAGHDAGFVVVDLGQIVVTRRWTRHPHTGAVQSSLEVRSADGMKMQRAQHLLDALLGRLSFDPLAFVRETPAKQLELVQQLVGLDFRTLEAQRATAYSDRTVIGRQLKAAEAEAHRQPLHEGVPEQPLEVSALVAELERALATHTAAAEARGRAQRAKDDAELGARELLAVRAEIAKLREREVQLSEQVAQHSALAEERGRTATALERDVIDPAPVKARLAEIENVNRLVRDNRDRAVAHEQVRRLSEEVRRLTSVIGNVDLEKERLASAARMPVAGLAFRHDGLLLGGVPFEQASQAEQIRVSVAMGAALHPELKVLLVRDGSLLGDDALALLQAIADEQGLQIWLERVAEPGEGESRGDVLVIEDGEAVLAAA